MQNNKQINLTYKVVNNNYLIKWLNDNIDKINSLEGKNLENLQTNELDDIIFNSEYLALLCRDALENRGMYHNYDPSNCDFIPRDFYLNNLPVEAKLTNDSLILTTQLTVKRNEKSPKKKAFSYSQYVKLALYKLKKEHQNMDFSSLFKSKFTIIVTRYIHKFNKKMHYDNDNFASLIEVQRAINDLCCFISKSDNILNCDIILRSQIDENLSNSYTEYRLTENKNIHKFL